MSEIVLFVGDIHEPFAHKDAYEFVKEVARYEKPTKIVLAGDTADKHALSDYDHDPNGFSAGQELEATIEAMQKWYKLFPEAMECTSNHNSRPLKKAAKAGIPAAYLRHQLEVLQAPKGWRLAEKWVIDGVTYFHGEGYSGASGARNASIDKGTNVGIGHIHAFAGIDYITRDCGTTWGFNVGCLIDEHAYAFAYGKTLRHRPSLGVGVIAFGEPYFHRMNLDSNGNWDGSIVV